MNIPADILKAVRYIEAELGEKHLNKGSRALTKIYARLITDFGFEPTFGFGQHRIVFIHKKHRLVLKVVRKRRDRIVNVGEHGYKNRMYDRKEQFRRYFPETRIPLSNGRVMVQEFAPPDMASYREREQEIHRIAAAAGVGDYHPDNVGWRSGEFFFIDPLDNDQLKQLRKGILPGSDDFC